MIAYLDASALIYLIEGRPPFAARIRKQLQTLVDAAPGMRTAVGRLAWLECRVGPMKTGDTATLAMYHAFFAQPDLIHVELSADVVALATAIRARHGLQTPDALHAACCLQLGSDHVFLTGDAAFRRVGGLRVRVLT
ncbi:MAG: type II toxin-antitoxin system VapC family toxin [Rhodanobacteraceae bacterium]